MLESIVGKVSSGIRSAAAEIAFNANCVVAYTLDVRLNVYPVFSEGDSEGLVRDLRSVTGLAEKDYMYCRGVVDFVRETDPACLIGVTASGEPRILIVPSIAAFSIRSNGEGSNSFVSCVGVYALRPRQSGVRYPWRFTSSPYTER